MRLRVGEGSGAPTPSASRQPEEQNGRSGLGRKAATPPGWCPHPSTPAWRVPVLPPHVHSSSEGAFHSPNATARPRRIDPLPTHPAHTNIPGHACQLVATPQQPHGRTATSRRAAACVRAPISQPCCSPAHGRTLAHAACYPAFSQSFAFVLPGWTEGAS